MANDVQQRKILLGVAWPYANGVQHLGHLAGAYLPPDIFARYNRLIGNDVLMVSGSDAHGTPITVRADAEGVPPRQIFERYHKTFLETYQQMGLTFDLFNLNPWLYTLPIPITVLAITAGTTAWTLSKLDAVAIIERRQDH